ncbi:recombination protein NinB [Entomomonas asaccharolytica]|uniref:Recombination protein NinB n=1 Tax=Entomomonas asaccharolytica TaxID=2785331 RepID=A0A974NHL7_9GAMM|nr:recombination protein NinB [Entomomonas asaccharolytica]QQP86921.1 recombination protein NinB [Entomomonas asaccharolytica]
MRSERKFRIQSQAGIELALKNVGNVLANLVDSDNSKDGYELVIRNYKSKRSLEQNKRYWAMLRLISTNVWIDYRTFNDEVWHEQFRRWFIGCEDIVLPTGTETRGISTTTLSVDEFGNYMAQIEQWCAEQGYPIMQEELVA